MADVTDLLAEAEVRAAHAFQQAVFSASPDTIIVYDLDVRSTVWTNRAVGEVLGPAARSSPDADVRLEDLLTAADPLEWEAALRATADARDGDAVLLNHRLTHARGGTRAFSLSLTPFCRDDSGRVTQVVGVMRDTTEALAAEERLEHAALHDDLTGLPNRRLVTDRLTHLLLGLDEGAEAVVLFCDLDGFKRVNDTQGHLNTLDVISVAEHTGIVSAVDQYVLLRACAQVAEWRRDPAHADLSVAVNRSAAEIARPGFCGRVTDVLAATGLDPQALTIEITETVVLEVTAHTIADLRRLREIGVGIAIDDFGTGYASLRYLATLPITVLKVDRSFTAGLPDDPACTTIVRATVGLADELGMICIVEGVETLKQLVALPDSPTLRVQGYLYSRPQAFTDGLPAHLDPMPPS